MKVTSMIKHLNYKYLVTLCFSFLFSSNVFAKTDCNQLARDIGYNVNVNNSNSQSFNENVNNFCSHEYSKASIEQKGFIEGSYNIIASGNAAGSSVNYTEKQSIVCNNQFGKNFKLNDSKVTSYLFSEQAMETIRSCMVANDSNSGGRIIKLFVTKTNDHSKITFNLQRDGDVADIIFQGVDSHTYSCNSPIDRETNKQITI
ncbi:MAG: hypothetical protein ABL867_10845, partial [Rickettsiales bacterium]